MTAKIIIDRKVKKGSVSEFLKLLEELRGKAVSAKGYISGETLHASEPAILIHTIGGYYVAQDHRYLYSS